MSQSHRPVRIDPLNDYEIYLEWQTGEAHRLPYLTMRFECPCAGCVDEMTGKRTLKKESLSPTVRPKKVELVGQYAVAVTWSDGHSTGMYHFDRLYEMAGRFGGQIKQPPQTNA